MQIIFILISIFIIYQMNRLMDAFCNSREIPDEKQPQVFRTTNILTMILLISAYVEILFT